ncbi:MAG: S-adenosylmethionine:tRNA ribosyltransferase-isomerase [Blastocatellia bacterium]|jgi:S-adenosylmethionine:tRNA ribosyltransferase-isomerase|nr:S-adenosylmethionine:tRNA ribosyltransferase-isomerase [Blastocatellia bacterium]
MRLADFDYDLPDKLIAQQPAVQRDASRMLIVDRAKQTFHDASFRDFPSCVGSGDLVVLNNTKVFPARLIGKRETSGGRVELFLIHEREPGIWEALVKPGRRITAGARIKFDRSSLQAEVLQSVGEGVRLVRLTCDGALEKAFEEAGQVPLPPYIKRPEGSLEDDRDRYQTVYARHSGAIAAPTAGLHFTPAVLQAVTDRSAAIVEITLHVGYGTFEPVRVQNIAQHTVAPERFQIDTESAEKINRTRRSGGRVIAIGTTTARALESAIDGAGKIATGTDIARITITPGHQFRSVDALLTNFHLPQSSLLLLVAAFAGRDLIMRAYAHAVAAEYRFYSYGDCMLIL